MRNQHQFLRPSFLIALGSLFIFMWTLFAVSAQEDSHTYTFLESGVRVTYADPWLLTENDDGSVALTNDTIRVTLYDSIFVSSHIQLSDSSTLADVLLGLRNILNVDSHTTFDQARLVEQILGTRVIVVYSYTPAASGLTGLFVALQFTDGTYGFANAVFPEGAAETDQLAVFTLLTTFDTVPTGSCMVRTDRANWVDVRVGPGYNRGEYMILPANQDFTVLGQAEIEGVVWWKLDKTELDPNGEAAELWVVEADVIASESCKVLAEIAATPPIIPPEVFVPVATIPPGGTGDPVVIGPTPTSPFDSRCPGTTTAELVAFAWTQNDPALVAVCVNNLRFWEREARAQQAERARSGQCNAQPSVAQLTSYFDSNWALTDVATGYYILGLRYKAAGQIAPAREAFNTVLNNYSCAWVWDPKGPWFWSLKTGIDKEMP